jgi:cell division protein FtsQ
LSESSTWHPSEETLAPEGESSEPAQPESPTPAQGESLRTHGEALGRLTPRQAGRGWALTVVGVFVVGLAAWVVTNSPLFDLRDLRVTGLKHLSREQVARLGALNSHTNVLWLSPGAVERRLERNPWILRAEISRNLPGTIAVSIEERTPVAVAWSSVRRLLVAADGTLLDVAPSSVRLPRIEARPSQLTVGNRLPHSTLALRAVASFPRRVRSRLDRVTVGTSSSITLLLRSGTHVLYGDGSRPDAKARAVFAVLAWARAHGIRAASLDVRAPDAPALRPAGVPAAVPRPMPNATDLPRHGPRP